DGSSSTLGACSSLLPSAARPLGRAPLVPPEGEPAVALDQGRSVSRAGLAPCTRPVIPTCIMSIAIVGLFAPAGHAWRPASETLQRVERALPETGRPCGLERSAQRCDPNGGAGSIS